MERRVIRSATAMSSVTSTAAPQEIPTICVGRGASAYHIRTIPVVPKRLDSQVGIPERLQLERQRFHEGDPPRHPKLKEHTGLRLHVSQQPSDLMSAAQAESIYTAVLQCDRNEVQAALEPVRSRLAAVEERRHAHAMAIEAAAVAAAETEAAERKKNSKGGGKPELSAVAVPAAAADYEAPEEPPVMWSIADCQGTMLLALAASRGACEVLADLLDCRCNPDAACGVSGETALMRAAARGHASTVRILVSRGASTTLCSRDGSTAAHFAARHGSTNALLAILRPDDGDGTSEGAEGSGKGGGGDSQTAPGEACEVIARRSLGEELNARTLSGTTPLMSAAAAGHTHLVEQMISGWLPTAYRQQKELEATVAEATPAATEKAGKGKGKGAAPPPGKEANGKGGGTPTAELEVAMAAAEQRRLQAYVYSALNAYDVNGWTALHHAWHRRQHATAVLLVNHGATTSDTRRGGRSLHSLHPDHLGRAELLQMQHNGLEDGAYMPSGKAPLTAPGGEMAHSQDDRSGSENGSERSKIEEGALRDAKRAANQRPATAPARRGAK